MAEEYVNAKATRRSISKTIAKCGKNIAFRIFFVLFTADSFLHILTVLLNSISLFCEQSVYILKNGKQLNIVKILIIKITRTGKTVDN